MTISVILATYNERENIAEMIQKIHETLGDTTEIIVVDDNSPDKTGDIVQSLGDPSVKVIKRKTRGLASAILRGIVESRGDIICWWDADMIMCPRVAAEMIPLLKDNHIIVGSRYVPGGGDTRGLSRTIPSIAINKFAGIILRHGIKDYDSGFVVFRREVINTVLPIPTGYGEYFIEFIYMAAKKGLKIHEHPYVLTDRTKGTSKSTTSIPGFLITGFQYGSRVIISLFREVFR